MIQNVSRLFIQASPQRVWQALTNPADVAQWQYGSALTTTWEEGTPIRFRSEWQGQIFEQWGTVLEVVPMQRICYSLYAPRPDLPDLPENYFRMIYELQVQDQGTQLVIIQEDPRPGAKQQAEQGKENPVLAQLKQLCES